MALFVVSKHDKGLRVEASKPDLAIVRDRSTELTFMCIRAVIAVKD